MNNRTIILAIIFDSLCWFALGFFVCFSTIAHGGEMKNKTNNDNVIKAWSQSNPANSYTENLRTDGEFLYSYALMIGFTSANNSKVLLDYTAPAQCFHSVTTSCHVGRARHVADDVMHPKAAEIAGFTSLDIPF